MDRVFTIMRWVTAAFVVVCSGLILWALYFEKPFLSYVNLPFPVRLAQVKAGEVIPLTVRRCNSSDVIRFYDVTHEIRSLSDPSRPPRILTSERVSIAPGCTEGVSLINMVPKNSPPGRYVVTGLGIVQGTARTFAVPWYSQPFEVVP